LGCFWFLALFFFYKDEFVRTFRVIQIVRVVMGSTVVNVTILHSNLHYWVIALFVGFLEL
jgi:hypothetical protein